MCVARDTTDTSVVVSGCSHWGIWSVSPKVLLQSGESWEVVWVIRSLRARIPGSFRPVDAVGPRGGEGHRRGSGDQDSRATSGDRASL